jgi:aminoglycoside/choline kinase family phosphotransferase
MTQSAALENRVHTYLQERGLGRDVQLVALTPDASERRYVRVLIPGSGTTVLAVYPQAIDYGALPFSSVYGLLRDMSLPVPRVLGYSNPLGIVELEDLGDVTLQVHLQQASSQERLRRYREALGLIVQIQQRAPSHAGNGYGCFAIAFDVEKLTWELNFFLQHFVESYRGAKLSPSERTAFATQWNDLAGDLASEPRVLCHRDFHSRNLMVHRGALHLIDFQDARMGPDTYDLASLLRDAYVDIGDQEREDLVDDFLSLVGAERSTYQRRLDVMSVQRTLKALGTFGYQATARNNPVYVPYMSRTLAYARAPLSRHERFTTLRELLATHLSELR